MTLGNNRISARHFNEGPVMVVYQKPGTLNQTMTHSLQETFCRWDCLDERGILHYTLQLLMKIGCMKRC